MSVSCGIPDFRSRDGIYAKLSVEYPDLPDPQAMFDIEYFYQNPRPFFKFAKVREVLFLFLYLVVFLAISHLFLTNQKNTDMYAYRCFFKVCLAHCIVWNSFIGQM